jgi:hypothetical protein
MLRIYVLQQRLKRDIALFRGVRYSESAEHPAVPYIPVPHSIKKHYKYKKTILPVSG